MRVAIWTFAIGIALSAVGVAYAGPAILRAAHDGRALLRQGRDDILANNTQEARAVFSRATAEFGAAESRLRTPLLWPIRAVPVASTQMAVTRSIASTGRQIADAGYALASAVERLPGGTLHIHNGVFPLPAIASAADALDAGSAAASDISDQVEAMPSGWVVPPLGRIRAEVRSLLPGAAKAVTKAQAALHGMPSMLGATRPKRYLIAFTNLAELRGSGGFIGYVTELSATGGRLHLGKFSGFPTSVFAQPGKRLSYPAWFPDDFRTQAELLQNINLTTDFPTAADLLLQAARAKTGRMDGVIGVDPDGVAALLGLTGPIHVNGWRPLITANNVAQVMQHDVYATIPNRAQRDAFFGSVVRTAFEKLVSSNIALRPTTIGAFDASVQGGHFRMYSNDVPDESLFRVLGLAGNVDRASGASDALSVVAENSSGNKIDWYLTKTLRYNVRLDPRSDIARTSLDIDLRNGAPSGGLPDYVIGSKVQGLARGTNRLTLMVVRSARDDLKSFAISGRRTNVLGTAESELHAYRTGVSIPPGGDVHVRSSSVVGGAFFGPSGSRTYRLHVMPQAMAHPDAYEIAFQAAKGWHVVGEARYSGKVDGDLVFDVRVAQTRRGFVVRVATAPYRLAVRLFHHVF